MIQRIHLIAPVIVAGFLIASGCAGCGKGGGSEVPVIEGPKVAAAVESAVRFVDATQAAHIQFAHNNGAFGARMLPETMGSGVAFIDYDGDGYQDMVLVNGRDWTAQEANAYKKSQAGIQQAGQLPPTVPVKGGTCALYHNNGDGTFTDMTAGSGLNIPMFGMGAAVGDFDADGKPDILITSVGRSYLFKNLGGGKFQDVSALSGLSDTGWSTSAAFLDYDKDGKLDLFICHYVAWSPDSDIWATVDGRNKGYTTPEQYTGEKSHLYHNEGSGKFKDVSQQMGIWDKTSSSTPAQFKSLGVCICDYDNDGWPDIVVANDTEPNYLFHNEDGKHFKELGNQVGIAVSESGMARASMGVDAADADHSGRESLVFGNFSNQMIGLYKNNGSGVLIDIAPLSEVGQASLQFLAFGACFVDIDNDGWPDFFTANGHLDDAIDRVQQNVTYKERPLLFRNVGQAKFQEIGMKAGDVFQRKIVGRGAAYADIDLDGDLDLIITTNDGPPILLKNEGGNKNGSIRLILEGTKSPRCGIGAVIEAKVGTETIKRMVRSGSSYCSQSELPTTIGLGTADKADSIKITWPSGKVTELKVIPKHQMLTIDEDKGEVKRQPFPH